MSGNSLEIFSDSIIPEKTKYPTRMATYVAFLRAVNVGGTGKLPMSELRVLCEEAGFKNVTTYIQSGNVVFSSQLDAPKAQQKLEKALAKKMGKPVGVHVRTPAELAAIIKGNPYKKAEPNRLLVYFLNVKLPKGAFINLTMPGREELTVLGREVFVHYPDGMGQSKLKLPFVSTATGRNLNTVQKMLELCRGLEASSS